ncbi:MAG: hypothetical protein MI723_00860 [Caulobacterales bacterium]|nr:hypothetical protein [Caulobacterales bacterium]
MIVSARLWRTALAVTALSAASCATPTTGTGRVSSDEQALLMLDAETRAAESAFERYHAEVGHVDAEDLELTLQQIASLDVQLSRAEADLAQDEARLSIARDRIAGGRQGSTLDEARLVDIEVAVQLGRERMASLGDTRERLLERAAAQRAAITHERELALAAESARYRYQVALTGRPMPGRGEATALMRELQKARDRVAGADRALSDFLRDSDGAETNDAWAAEQEALRLMDETEIARDRLSRALTERDQLIREGGDLLNNAVARPEGEDGAVSASERAFALNDEVDALRARIVELEERVSALRRQLVTGESARARLQALETQASSARQALESFMAAISVPGFSAQERSEYLSADRSPEG